MTLEMIGLNKHYGKVCALHDFNYVCRNGIYGILGANGAGKSTLVGLLTDTLRRDKKTGGAIRYDGRDILELKEKYRELIGYVPQHISFYDDFTVKEFTGYIMGLKGIRRKDHEKEIFNILEVMHLTDRLNVKIGCLSGGLQRRVLLCCALLGDPKILILDEPTVGLDPEERMAFKNHISVLSREKIILLISHIVEDMEHIADEILIMKDGRMVVSGTERDLKNLIAAKTAYINIPESDLDGYQERYVLSSIRKWKEGELRIKLIGDRLPSEASLTDEVSLEDVYMYCIKVS